MFNPKTAITFSIIGFTLSFIIGLISSNSIGHCFITALLYGVMFGILGVGISFIYQKFLSIPGDGNSGAGSGENETAETSQNKGTKVDITLDDEVLPEDDDSPKFFVNSNKTGLAESINETAAVPQEPVSVQAGQEIQAVDQSEDSKTVTQPVAESQSGTQAEVESLEEPSQGFVPVTLGASAETSTESKSSSAGGEADLDSLDALPDIGALAPEEDEKNEEESENFVSDSDFATAGSSSSGSYSSGSSQPMEQNAALMAKAISTALARQDS